MNPDQQSFRLIASLRSPFARRIRTALRGLDLPHEEQFINVFEEQDLLIGKNPLKLVPTLWHPRQGWLYESSTILQILDDEFPGVLWPKSPNRPRLLKISGLATGVMAASVNYFLETNAHQVPSPEWAKEHFTAVGDGLKAINDELQHLSQTKDYCQTHADIGIAAEYAGLRLPDLRWGEQYPELQLFIEYLRTFPWFEATRPHQ
jgi:glutathione S-transferase